MQVKTKYGTCHATLSVRKVVISSLGRTKNSHSVHISYAGDSGYFGLREFVLYKDEGVWRIAVIHNGEEPLSEDIKAEVLACILPKLDFDKLFAEYKNNKMHDLLAEKYAIEERIQELANLTLDKLT